MTTNTLERSTWDWDATCNYVNNLLELLIVRIARVLNSNEPRWSVTDTDWPISTAQSSVNKLVDAKLALAKLFCNCDLNAYEMWAIYDVIDDEFIAQEFSKLMLSLVRNNAQRIANPAWEDTVDNPWFSTETVKNNRWEISTMAERDIMIRLLQSLLEQISKLIFLSKIVKQIPEKSTPHRFTYTDSNDILVPTWKVIVHGKEIFIQIMFDHDDERSYTYRYRSWQKIIPTLDGKPVDIMVSNRKIDVYDASTRGRIWTLNCLTWVVEYENWVRAYISSMRKLLFGWKNDDDRISFIEVEE